MPTKNLRRVTADRLEQLAFDSGGTIELDGMVGYLDLDGVTYYASMRAWS